MTEADIPSLAHALGSDKSTHNTTLRIPWPYTETQARQFFNYTQRIANSDAAQLGARQYVIRLGSPDGPVVGGFGWEADEITRDHDTPKDATPCVEWTIGYWLVAAYRGQGILPALVQEGKKAAEADERVARMVITCFSDNPASKRVAEKAGFTLEGTMRRSTVKHGQVKDQLVFSWIPRVDKL
ncbi:acyl-CoA N-acyltransferase [Catenaria anguillulae PL171]|uniref:Acyl-CoA N-acyltransferase n=1 Tax=Catenaria anguillulae PL171 TaxID=765915 RepID=A0A1Y2HM19_9FUNG|nr:acyl-CoA N-acyltransferase [Catenaria anguillulae PL171]